MEIKSVKDGSKLTVSPEGRIDTATSPEFSEFMNDNIDGVTELVFDLKQLRYLSSAGLRELMNAQKIMNKQGKMKFINVNETVMDIFDLTGLADVFESVYPKRQYPQDCSSFPQAPYHSSLPYDIDFRE